MKGKSNREMAELLDPSATATLFSLLQSKLESAVSSGLSTHLCTSMEKKRVDMPTNVTFLGTFPTCEREPGHFKPTLCAR